MNKFFKFFKEHDDIEIVLVYLPVTITACVILYYTVDGIIEKFV